MRPDIHGIVAEFDDPDALIKAAHAAKEAGYRHVDAFTPFPVEEVIEELHDHHDRGVQRITLLAGVTGALSGFILQYIGAFVDYRINVAGRPLPTISSLALLPSWDAIIGAFDGWAAFIPITFEFGILFASFSAAIGMIALNNFPQPYHPVFNVPNFERASQDRFFLCIEAKDPLFDRSSTRQFLQGLRPLQVTEVQQ